VIIVSERTGAAPRMSLQVTMTLTRSACGEVLSVEVPHESGVALIGTARASLVMVSAPSVRVTVPLVASDWKLSRRAVSISAAAA
jgi:hypothetical protein